MKSKNLLSLILAGFLTLTGATACTSRQTINQDQTIQSSYVKNYGGNIGGKLDLLFSDSTDYCPFWGIRMYDKEDIAFFVPIDPVSKPIGRQTGIVFPIENLNLFVDKYCIRKISEIADRSKIINRLQKKEKRDGLKEYERILIDNKNATYFLTSDGPIMIYPILNKKNGEIERALILYLYEAEFHDLSEED